MRLSSLLTITATYASAAALSLVAASFSADLIEDNSEREVLRQLTEKGMTWANVHAEGLQVFITGVAPSEATRFNAISAAGAVVDAARVIDNMQVAATADIAPPRFSVEILRNDSGISLIGLIPRGSDRDEIVEDLHDLAGAANVTDLLETAAYDVPDGWAEALTYALWALDFLPRSKISVESGQVQITAMSDSQEARDKIQSKLTRKAPTGVVLTMDISAPRPVITPFTLRFLIDESGARFDACSADTQDAQGAILKAAALAGMERAATCTIGLGVPSPSWQDAVTTAIQGLAELGAGSVTFSDADITLVAQIGTDQATFDKVIGEMEAALPDVFALHATLPVALEADDTGIPEFTATLSPEGLLQMRGRLRDDLSRSTTESYAHARFGTSDVYMAARLDTALPASWSIRVMAGLDALSKLHNGVLMVTPDSLGVRGTTGSQETNAVIAQLLADKLSQSDHFTIDVTYSEKLDPVAQLPSPDECELAIKNILTDQQIKFKPGSGTLDENAGPILDQIAEVLKDCADVRLEIQGHTDSQGREEMNQALSQTRAQSVLTALQERRILTSSYSAKGYGESQPIADNDTEAGREANRRIEFVLFRPAPVAEEQTTLEASEKAPDADPADPADPAEAVSTPDTATQPTAASDGNSASEPQDTGSADVTPETDTTPTNTQPDAGAQNAQEKTDDTN
ncbi:BON domain-containing protein [Shimia litoralis]|uniref:BON domain-containing protein n=1 Tax=Shimia litoralis TaxID=420403 RepID=A0A4U7N9A0_9RHOB|nr:OmpA family protein [Shimia litoralis]TKZ22313.1 BON domain-containing protein [Shimia litoralis]